MTWRRSQPQGWPRLSGKVGHRVAVTSCVLWATVVTTSASLSVLTPELDLHERVHLVLQLGACYGLAGLVLSYAAIAIEARLGGWRAWSAAAAATVVSAALHLALVQISFRLMPGSGLGAVMSFVPELSQHATHALWDFSFYGGIYLGAFFMFLRSTRRQLQLRRAEHARLIAETRVDALMLENHEKFMQPSLVLRALSELGQRYAEDPDGADQLLESMVRFLRSALAGLAGSSNDSGAALELAESRTALCAELERNRSSVQLSTRSNSHELPA